MNHFRLPTGALFQSLTQSGFRNDSPEEVSCRKALVTIRTRSVLVSGMRRPEEVSCRKALVTRAYGLPISFAGDCPEEVSCRKALVTLMF